MISELTLLQGCHQHLSWTNEQNSVLVGQLGSWELSSPGRNKLVLSFMALMERFESTTLYQG